MFFDLSIPYLENPKGDAAKNKILKLHRLKTLARAMELGYTAVAYDRPFKGVMSDADRCRIPLFSLPSLLEVSHTLPSSVSLHRRRNGVPASAPFRQYTRVTVAVDRMSVVSAFNGKSLLRSYDLVAAKPLDQDAFDKACQVSDVDVITLDFPLKFRLKLQIVESAIKRGIHFEIKYSNLIADVHIRRQMLSDARLLVDWTRGKNLFISSSARSINDIRGPYDVANLSSFLLGLSKERAKAAISGNCRSLIANALRKKDYKEAIRIEKISSDEQLDSDIGLLGDWKEWDPISSGEGDLPPLDDISKLFSAVSKLPKSPAIDFQSCVNRFSIKDHISSAGKNLLAVGDKETHISCSKEPESGAATMLSSSINDIPVDDRKSVTVKPLGLQISSCDGEKVSPSNMLRVFADSAETVIAVAASDHEILENSIQDEVASDAAGIPLSDIRLDHCTFTGKDSLVPPDSNLISGSAIDKISTMCMDDVKNSDRSNVASVAIETPRAVTELVDTISSCTFSHLSSNVGETFSTRSLEKVFPDEQIKAKAVESEGNNEVLGDDAPLQMDIVEPCPIEEMEYTRLLPDDVPSENGFSELKKQEKEVLVDSDACMGEVLVKLEDHNQQGSTKADGCASYARKSGKGRRKGRSYPAYPLPFKGLLKPMLFKKKSCQSRRPSKHCSSDVISTNVMQHRCSCMICCTYVDTKRQ